MAISAELRRKAMMVGVFVNASLDEIATAAEDAQLDGGAAARRRGPSFCQEVARRTGCKVIKAMRVRSGADVRAAETFRTDYHLLDAHRPATPGGTGASFDWVLAAERNSTVPMILAGGLTPDNVAEAIEIARPYAVDVASGIEAAPGGQGPRADGEPSPRRPGSPPAAPGPRRSGPAGGAAERGVDERFGPYGGRFVPEVLIAALDELTARLGRGAHDAASRRSSTACCATSSAARRRSIWPSGSPSESAAAST